MFNTIADYTRVNIITDKTGVEGGYVKDPSDSGGETNFGCTKALCDEYSTQLKQLFNWDGKMINLTKEMAFWLYTTHFWKRMGGDDLLAVHPLIADKMFDFAINSGVTTAVSALQTILNLNNNNGALYPDLAKIDGGYGALTSAALKAYVKARGKEGIERLLVALLAYQGDNFKDIAIRRSKDEKFYYGWLGRVTRDVKIYSKLLWG